MTEVSSTRLYLGNLPRSATKQDVEAHFNTHGTGEITEIKLMNGFGFIEYKDAMDARDVVPAFHGSDFMGERLTVQFARGSRRHDTGVNGRFDGHHDRSAPRPRRTPHRMQISGLPGDTSWQDLKDFARQSSLDVVYSETGRDRDGKGFVEFETAADLRTAVEKLDGRDFKGVRVTCVADVSNEYPPPYRRPYTNYYKTQPDMPRDRMRSRSPGRRGPMDDYDRRGPPRGGYSPRRDSYRERSPRRDYYDDRRGGGGYRSPPRARGPPEDYPPRRGGAYDEPYRRDYPPVDPYVNGAARPYERGPPRDYPPPRDAPYPRDYDRRY